MIGIKESILPQKICEVHSLFVRDEIVKRIEFYIDLFNVLTKLKKAPKLSNSKINISITELISFKNNKNKYRYLINGLYHKKYISSERDIYKIKHFNKIKHSLSNFQLNIEALKVLKRNVYKLLTLEFQNDYKKQLAFYFRIRLKTKQIEELIKYIIDYKNWFALLPAGNKWGPYELLASLGLNVCPYCNRLFTTTFKHIGGSLKPEIDHFLPQKEHCLLALSFYNLIPSCSICNHTLKGQNLISYKQYLNPYEENISHNLMRFDYTPKTYEASIGESNEVEIDIKYSGTKKNIKKKVENNIKLFRLKEVYQAHVDFAREIIKKRHISGDRYLKIIKKTFTGLKWTDEELYLLAYGNFYSEKEFCRRPLAKFTKDIAVSVGSLKKL